uniref:Uncharacterized protein n=1 Tax=Oryza sativa subsp. japonica TaxID=39947 RepID=Q6EP82_ORYSJ|nr:hypothetical protein [Oryza sativa Japonica Group]BAD29538.1 hypothetical protein [Oryza sativa Japonica Group]
MPHHHSFSLFPLLSLSPLSLSSLFSCKPAGGWGGDRRCDELAAAAATREQATAPGQILALAKAAAAGDVETASQFEEILVATRARAQGPAASASDRPTLTPASPRLPTTAPATRKRYPLDAVDERDRRRIGQHLGELVTGGNTRQGSMSASSVTRATDSSRSPASLCASMVRAKTGDGQPPTPDGGGGTFCTHHDWRNAAAAAGRHDRRARPRRLPPGAAPPAFAPPPAALRRAPPRRPPQLPPPAGPPDGKGRRGEEEGKELEKRG